MFSGWRTLDGPYSVAGTQDERNDPMGPLDKFGKFITANLRDKAIEQNEMLLKGAWKGKAIQSLQSRLTMLPETEKQLIREMVADLVDIAMHDVLCAIQEAHDRELGIEVVVDGENVAQQSGMLHGEHLGEGGWVARFSKYPPSITTSG